MAQAERVLIKTLEQKVLKFIDRQKLIKAGERLLFALSGGPDSVFILTVLNKYKSRFGIIPGAMHVNHSLRGAESDEDENFCRELSARLGVEYFADIVDVKSFALKKKISVEEAARVLRYQSLMATAARENFDKIVTAHNMSDNAETVILNLIKGTGLKGISGIPVRRENIIRPALCVNKQEILEYLHFSGIPYRLDSSNNDNRYERNFIRNFLLPEIKKNLNPSVELSLFNSSENFRNSAGIIDGIVNSVLINIIEFNSGRLHIDLPGLENYDKALWGEILKGAVLKYFGSDFLYNDYLKIESLFGKQTGRRVEISSGYNVYREREKLLIEKIQPEKEFVPVTLKTGEEAEFDGLKISLIKISPEEMGNHNTQAASDRYHEFISADNFNDEFLLRTWQAGDRFIPLGMRGFKKISDFLSEQKVPSSQKQKQLVLLNQGKIIWVPGLRIDDRFKITENSKRILKLCLESTLRTRKK